MRPRDSPHNLASTARGSSPFRPGWSTHARRRRPQLPGIQRRPPLFPEPDGVCSPASEPDLHRPDRGAVGRATRHRCSVDGSAPQSHTTLNHHPIRCSISPAGLDSRHEPAQPTQDLLVKPIQNNPFRKGFEREEISLHDTWILQVPCGPLVRPQIARRSLVRLFSAGKYRPRQKQTTIGFSYQLRRGFGSQEGRRIRMDMDTVLMPNGEYVFRNIGDETILVPVRAGVSELDSLFTLMRLEQSFGGRWRPGPASRRSSRPFFPSSRSSGPLPRVMFSSS